MVSTLSRADSFLAEHEAAVELAAQRVRNSKKSRTKKRKGRYERDIVLTQALQNLCGGLHKVSDGRRGWCEDCEADDGTDRIGRQE